MKQIIEEFSSDDIARVEAQRKWVRNHFSAESMQRYETLEGKLELLDTILQNKWIESDETVKLQCLGITFGDALVQKINLKWVTIEDEYGRDPALVMPGTTVKVFPLTSISKRIEQGENIDIYKLFDSACDMINELIQQ